jgi:hypothetical protein
MVISQEAAGLCCILSSMGRNLAQRRTKQGRIPQWPEPQLRSTLPLGIEAWRSIKMTANCGASEREGNFGQP